MFIYKLIFRHLTLRAMKQVLQGRMKVREVPEAGRFLRSEIKEIHDSTWRTFDQLLGTANLREIPTLGNRFIVLLTMVTILSLPKRFAQTMTANPLRQIDLFWRMLLRFPFSTPGRPGYEVIITRDSGRILTQWTYCAAFHYIEQYLRSHPDHGEMEAFYRSWCWYDWSIAYEIAEGSGAPGYYHRSQTLSRGDPVCDMCWSDGLTTDDSGASNETAWRRLPIHFYWF